MADRRTSKKRLPLTGVHLTPEERAIAQDTFLAAFATCGNISHACKTAEIGRTTVYEWQERDEPFGFRFQQARAAYCDRLRQEIDRRAVRGTLKPVFQGGVKVGVIREYSDTLLIFQAKALMAEYREKVQVEQTGTIDVPALVALRSLIEQTFPNDPEALERLADALATQKVG